MAKYLYNDDDIEYLIEALFKASDKGIDVDYALTILVNGMTNKDVDTDTYIRNEYLKWIETR